MIDANSQFTRVLKRTDNPFTFQSPNIKMMVDQNVLRCGHYVFGIRHNVLSVVVDGGNAEFIGAMGGDFTKKLSAFAAEVFKGDAEAMIGQALLIYPIESSAPSLIGRLLSRLPPDERRFGLAKTFHDGTQYELRFEPEIEAAIGRAAQSGRLLLIVFDDSRSSGETERRAVQAVADAFVKTPSKPEQPPLLAVFSYAVVNRLRSTSTAIERRNWAGAAGEIATRRENYIVLPHQSTDENNCRICLAERRAHIGLVGLGDGYNDLVGKHTRSFVEFVRRKHADASDHHAKEDEFIPALTWRLCQLETSELPELCYHFRDRSQLLPEEGAALLLHLASHYADARAFVAEHSFLELLLSTLGHAKEGGAEDLSYFSFFLALAILPIDLSCRLFERPMFYQIAARLESGQMASIILFLLRTHYFSLANTLAAADQVTAERQIGKRQIQLVGRILTNLQTLQAEIRGEDQKKLDEIEALKAKILALGGHAGTRSPVNLARLIGIRMFDGPHASYAKTLLENSDATACMDGRGVGLHVLDSMAEFCRMVNSPHERRLGEIVVQYQTKARKALEERARTDDFQVVVNFNRQLLETLEHFWLKERVVQDHLHSLEGLHGMITESRDRIKSDPNLVASVITDKVNSYVSTGDVPGKEKLWWVLGPSKLQLSDLIRNLLLNPFVHYNEEIEKADIPSRARLFDEMASRPGRHVQVGVTYKVDLETQRLLLAFSDNAKPAKVEKVALGQKGLGNSHLYLATVDCTLDHFRIEKGNLVPGTSGLSRQIAKAIGTQFPRCNNLFVITLPLIFKSSS